MERHFIGLGHYSRTGKDSFANYLGEHLKRLAPACNFIKRPLAWKLKQMAHELYGWAGLQPPEFYDTQDGEKLRDEVLPPLGKTPVQIWVAFGMGLRRDVSERTWLDYVLKNTDKSAEVVVVPDIRLQNEFDAFYANGALLIKVVRPGYGPRKTVPDRELLAERRWHYVIGAGGMPELHTWAEHVARWIVGQRPLPPQSKFEKQAQLAVQKIEPWEPQ